MIYLNWIETSKVIESWLFNSYKINSWLNPDEYFKGYTCVNGYKISLLS